MLEGGSGNDLLVGGEGVDELYGGSGNDTLVGTEGEVLDGASGRNQIIAAPMAENPNCQLARDWYVTNEPVPVPVPDRTSLAGLDFPGCDLSGVILYSADLTNADFPNAILVNANLGNAILTYATLDRTDLTNAYLFAAVMDEATVNGVTWNNTVCPTGANSDDVGGTCEGYLGY